MFKPINNFMPTKPQIPTCHAYINNIYYIKYKKKIFKKNSHIISPCWKKNLMKNLTSTTPVIKKTYENLKIYMKHFGFAASRR